MFRDASLMDSVEVGEKEKDVNGMNEQEIKSRWRVVLNDNEGECQRVVFGLENAEI